MDTYVTMNDGVLKRTLDLGLCTLCVCRQQLLQKLDISPPKRLPAQKKPNKTCLLWNKPGYIRENPSCRSAPERPFNWDVNKTWNLSLCLRLREFLVPSDKEGFLGCSQVCFKTARFCWFSFFLRWSPFWGDMLDVWRICYLSLCLYSTYYYFSNYIFLFFTRH